MKLINEDLNNEIVFEENKVNLLVIENKKKFVEFIQEIIKQINGDEGKFSLFDINTELKIHCLIENYDYPLEIAEGLDLKELFKLLSVKLSLCFSNKVEEILEYIDLVSNVLKKEIFILVNFHIFLEKDDIVALYRECFYKKIKLLFAESQKPDIINEEEKLFIIDNDLCEINLS